MGRTTAQLRATTTFDGVPVSWAHRIVLEAAQRAGVRFDVNDGRRTLAVQRARIAKHGLWSPSNPTGAAPAEQGSPHVKYGRADHALDVDQFTPPPGGQLRLAAFYRRRGVPVAFNVSTEAWHMDTLSESALLAAARRFEPAPDPFARYPADERRWLREYDELRAVVGTRADTTAKRKRRIVLRDVMADRRKSIWRAAQDSGWDKLNRRARYRSLLART